MPAHYQHHACMRIASVPSVAQGVYAGVFPVKCNHDRSVLECVLEAGRAFSYGLEVGSKAEMLMAMSMMGSSPGALLICNGYKDAAFMRLVGPGQLLGTSLNHVWGSAACECTPTGPDH